MRGGSLEVQKQMTKLALFPEVARSLELFHSSGLGTFGRRPDSVPKNAEENIGSSDLTIDYVLRIFADVGMGVCLPAHHRDH
jgi:hypothetical protein